MEWFPLFTLYVATLLHHGEGLAGVRRREDEAEDSRWHIQYESLQDLYYEACSSSLLHQGLSVTAVVQAFEFPHPPPNLKFTPIDFFVLRNTNNEYSIRSGFSRYICATLLFVVEYSRDSLVLRSNGHVLCWMAAVYTSGDVSCNVNWCLVCRWYKTAVSRMRSAVAEFLDRLYLV